MSPDPTAPGEPFSLAVSAWQNLGVKSEVDAAGGGLQDLESLAKTQVCPEGEVGTIEALEP